MDAPMHIVHVVTSFGCGGLERVIANLISHSDPVSHKHSVISLTDDLSFQYALPDYVTLLTLNKRPGKDIGAHGRMLKALRELKPDVFHTYNFSTLEYHPVAKLAGVKHHVHADHGLGGDHPEGKDRKHNIFRRIISGMIDDYVVVSDDLKNWVTKTVGVSEHKVHFVFNGVNIPPPEALPQKPAGTLNMVIVGRLHAVKNHNRLLEAMAKAQADDPSRKLSLTIVGDGGERGNITKTIETLSLQDSVTLAGHQNDVSRFILESDLFVLSSDYEAMPMTVLESMALSRPVICPRVGGVADFVTEDDVFLVPGKDTQALANMIGHIADQPSDAYQDKVALAYDKVASRYSIDAMVARYNTLYAGC